jgi:hypothetical protein
MAYTDELEAMLEYEQALRDRIAARIAEEQGAPQSSPISEVHRSAADEAIAGWAATGEEEFDPHAFRPVGPLQELLAEHLAVVERIIEERDRRLS